MIAALISLYGLLVLGLGILGYALKGSLPSLIMGLLCGIVLLITAWGVHRKCTFSFYTALGMSVFLTLFFTYRYYITLAAFPAGLMAGISAAVAILLYFSKEK